MNKKTTLQAAFAILAFALVAVANTGNADAQSAQTAKVIIIDTQEITRSSLAGKDLLRQIENYRAELEAEQARLEQEFKTAEAELVRQQSILTQEAWTEKARAMQEELRGPRIELQDRSRRLQIAADRASQELQSALMPIYQELLAKYGANLLIDRGMAVLTGPGMNVTQTVIEKLDAALPALKLDVRNSVSAR